MATTQKVGTNVYIDQYVKDQAKELFKKLHISLGDAINLFLYQSVLKQNLPFQVKIPNAQTLKAMQEVKNGETETISFEDHLLEMKQCIKN